MIGAFKSYKLLINLLPKYYNTKYAIVFLKNHHNRGAVNYFQSLKIMNIHNSDNNKY